MLAVHPISPRANARYPDAYLWFVLAGALDLMLTYVLLSRFHAVEVNPVAAAAIAVGGYWGLIALKVATIVAVVLICNYVGAARERLGRRVAHSAVALSSVPVAAALAQLAAVA